jgi:FkbM family methyltransferase
MIVVDVGCASYANADSVGYLVERFSPSVLYGFDPNQEAEVRNVNGTRCVLSPQAGWTHDGYLTFYRDEHDWAASRAWETLAGDNPADVKPCIDVAGFIQKLSHGEEVVLKLDCEGAEYPILERLHSTTLDRRLTLLLVEWHSEQRVEVDCPVEEWGM